MSALLIFVTSDSVRCLGLSSYVCPLALFQKATRRDLGRTCSGPTPFLAVSYSAASAGYSDCSELQIQAFLLAQWGQAVLKLIRCFGVASNRCGWPLGHLVQIQCTNLLLPAVILSGSRPALRILSKSNSSIAGCWLWVKPGCLFHDLVLFMHMRHPDLCLTLPSTTACQL